VQTVTSLRAWRATQDLWARGRVELDLRDLRVAGALLLAAAVVLPFAPGDPGVACPLRTLTGIPCPLCGMTTSVEAAVRLDLAAAFHANPAGIAAVAIALALLIRPPDRAMLHQAVLSGGLGTMWLFELHRFGLI